MSDTTANKPGIWTQLGHETESWPDLYHSKAQAFLSVAKKAPDATISEIAQLAKQMGLRIELRATLIDEETP